MGKIYTKTGDFGSTGSFRGRGSKAEILPEALGSLDELNSWIGYCRTTLSDPPPNLGGGRHGGGINLISQLKNIQTNLFVIASALAGSPVDTGKLDSETGRLEKQIDQITEKLPKLVNFIYPTGYLQVVRAVCRRAERKVVEVLEKENMQEEKYKSILKYINRLSDYLFTLARWENKGKGLKEEVWKGS